MALIKRISRLFAADMHAVLDQLEEPELVLKQAIREMEDELARQAQHGKRLEKESDALKKHAQALAAAQEDLDAKLDTCFELGNDDLARKLTRRKLESAKRAEWVASRLGALQDERAELAGIIATNRGQLDSLQQKAELLVTERTACSDALDGPVDRIGEDEVEIAFLREKHARAAS